MPRLTEKFSMWFDYPDDPDGGRVEIESLSDQDVAAIRAKAQITRVVYDASKDAPTQETQILLDVDRQETIERAVKSWENFFDQDGNQMPCNKDTRRQWAQNADFVGFVNRSLMVVNAEARTRTAERRKN
jgi:hypothetical protein